MSMSNGFVVCTISEHIQFKQCYKIDGDSLPSPY
jgi:hypothetical protein